MPSAVVGLAEAVRGEYEAQAQEIAADYWLRVLAAAGLAHHEMVGSKSKTEKFLVLLAEKLRLAKEQGIGTKWLVDELEKRTGIELEVENEGD